MSNSNKLLPKTNIRYRTTKSPDTKPKNNKNPNDAKKISVMEEMQQMKQRREDRKKRIEEEKQHKKDLLNDPNYIPKLDYDFEYLISVLRHSWNGQDHGGEGAVQGHQLPDAPGRRSLR